MHLTLKALKQRGDIPYVQVDRVTDAQPSLRTVISQGIS